jgi:mRNA interferase MazF
METVTVVRQSNYINNQYNINQQVSDAILRGDIFLVDLGVSKGSIQGLKRPCVIISNNAANKFSPVIHVVPITSASTKRPLPTHVNIPTEYGVDKNSVILCEQQTIVNKFQVMYKIGHCDNELMEKINKGLKIQLDLVDETENNSNKNKSVFPPNLRHNPEVFDMSKARQLAKSANEWEMFINKNKHKGYDLKDAESTLDNYIAELISYCKKFNQNISKFYQSKIDNTLEYRNGVSSNEKAVSF